MQIIAEGGILIIFYKFLHADTTLKKIDILLHRNVSRRQQLFNNNYNLQKIKIFCTGATKSIVLSWQYNLKSIFAPIKLEFKNKALMVREKDP